MGIQMSDDKKYSVKDVMTKVNTLIERSNDLGNDYKKKHNELQTVFNAFKIMAAWIEKQNSKTSDDCAGLIEDLMKLIQQKSELLKPEEEMLLKKMKLKQQEIMENFNKTGKSVSQVVTELKSVLEKSNM